MTASVIISYYKNIAALELLLLALKKQSSPPIEVIIAEDDNASETPIFVGKIQEEMPFKIVLLSQKENDGFRKNEMLNRAVKQAQSKLIAFLDGDCIPHAHWLKQCIQHTKPKHPVFGRRVMLSESLTKKIYSSKNLSKLNVCDFILHGCKRVKYGLYLPFTKVKSRGGMWGCNWAVYKTDLEAIDGFDEQYTKAGIGEDVDVEWRFNQHGIHFNSVRHHCLVYHLHHESNYSDDDVAFNQAILDKKKASFTP